MPLATEPTLPHIGHALARLDDFGAHDISAAVVIDVEGHPILGAVSDEGRIVAFVPLEPDAGLEPLGFDLGTVTTGIDDKEIDLEGVTVHNGALVAIGSLSFKRRRVKDKHDLEEALERLAKVGKASGGKRTHSDHAYVLQPRLDHGRLTVDFVRRIEVRSHLAELPLLAPFATLPSKDNGLDVEGLTFHEGSFYLGLRGPVLRGQALLVRTTSDFESPTLLPLGLDGWGIRAVTPRGPGELWVVSGPTMAHPGPFTLWRVEPHATPRPKATRMGELAVPGAGKVETVFAYRGTLHILVDGLAGGDPRTVLRCDAALG
ncbi:MAG: DUF3616 domain-containing protein [Myxococcota bacterium]